MANPLEEFVLVKGLWHPKSNVLVASGELAVRFELSDLSLAELSDEALVLAPEKSDVLDIEELHSPALQP